MVKPTANSNPPGQFPTTCWSVVLAARGTPQGDALAALETLCAAYWFPLYAFIRSRGLPAHSAEDLTQSFFTRLIEKGVLDAVDRSKGRLRAFLLAACKDFLANHRDYEGRKKRGGGRQFVPIDAEGRLGALAAQGLTPEALFDRKWAVALLERVLERLAAEMDSAGRSALFDRLKPVLLGESQAPSYSDVAVPLGMTEGAVKVAAHRLRARYRELLRDEIGQTVADPADIEDEIRALFQALAGSRREIV
jgi:DNA-directed RNA polymerase specialized sigma24 family protein